MIKEISKNKFTSKDNKERYLFELFPVDLEQKDRGQLISEINHCKKELNHLSDTEIYKIYNFEQKVILDKESSENKAPYFDSKPFLEGVDTFIKGENVYSDPIFKDDYIKINGSYFRFIYLQLQEDHQIDIADMQKHGEYFLIFKKIKTMISKLLISDTRKMNHSALYNALSDIEGIETYKENEEMLRKLIKREEELFKVEITYIVKASTEIELVEKTQEMLTSLDVAGLSPKIETIGQGATLKNYIPGLYPKFNRSMYFHTSLLANTLPLHEDKINSTGIILNSRSGREVKVNILEADSFSTTITGKTGNGKTFFANKIIDHEISNGRKVFVIDPKTDFRKHALLKNAYIIEESINPMMFKDSLYLRDLILSKVPKSERTAMWEGKLLNTIRKTRAYEENHFFNALEIIEKNGFKDIQYYFEDVADKITDKKIDLADFTYVEFGSFSNSSLPMILSFAFEYVKQLNSPYNLIIDEASRVFKHDPDFLEERVREMRVQRSSLTTMTQNYEDLMSNKFGRIVADNSYHKFFFSQVISNQIQSIDNFDLENIDSLRTQKGEYSECYYKTDKHRKVLRYYPTLKEYELYKSDNIENKKMLNFINEQLRYFTVEESINQWVRSKYAL